VVVGPPTSNQKRLKYHLQCLACLKDVHGLTGVGVMDAYFRLGIAPFRRGASSHPRRAWDALPVR
jgi:hypothetical protein